MIQRRSVVRRLKRDLALVGLVGAVTLLIAVGYFYSFAFKRFPFEVALARTFREILEHVALPVAVLMIPVTVVVLTIIRQALAPLAEAAAHITNAQAQERGYRVDDSRMPSEVLPFTSAVNDLLARTDEAARRHEAFAADVAHELRTPLALLSLELDRLDDPAASRLQADVAAMRRLIEQLMLLAQIDADAIAQTPLERVCLSQVAREGVASLAPAIIDGGATLNLEDHGADVVAGRREAIAAALRNLIENAARVTPAGGVVEVVAGPGPLIGVRDQGPGLAAEQLRVLARRHHRADHASASGAGLGLAIVDRIMASHGGALETAPERRELILRFP